mgnify:CR=1 FL=1
MVKLHFFTGQINFVYARETCQQILQYFWSFFSCLDSSDAEYEEIELEIEVTDSESDSESDVAKIDSLDSSQQAQADLSVASISVWNDTYGSRTDSGWGVTTKCHKI